MTETCRKPVNIIFNVDIFGNLTKITSEDTETIKATPKIDASKVKVANFDCRSCKFGQYQMNFYFKFPFNLQKSQDKTIRVRYCRKIGAKKRRKSETKFVCQTEALEEVEEDLFGEEEFLEDDEIMEQETLEQEDLSQTEESQEKQEVIAEPAKPALRLKKLSKSAIEKLKLHRLNSPAIYASQPSDVPKVEIGKVAMQLDDDDLPIEKLDETMEEILDEDTGTFVQKCSDVKRKQPSTVISAYTEKQREDFMKKLNMANKMKPKNSSPHKIKIGFKTLMKNATVIKPPIESVTEMEVEAEDDVQVFTQCEDDANDDAKTVEPFNVYFDHEKEEKSRPWWDRIKTQVKFTYTTNGKCNYCDLELGNQVVWRHLKTHGIYPVLCEVCGRGEIQMSQLAQHIDCTSSKFRHTVFPKKPYVKKPPGKRPPAPPVKRVCNFCGIMYVTKTTLIDHLAKVHGVGRLYQCPECPYSHANHANFVAHMLRRHSPNEVLPIACSKCDKRLATNSDLKIHMMMHTNLKKNVCEQCGKAYKHKCDLANHMFVHTGEMPYACRFCGKRFQDKGNKNAHHRRFHAEEWENYKNLPLAERRNEEPEDYVENDE